MGVYLSRIFWKSTSRSATLFTHLSTSLRSGMGTYLSRIFVKQPNIPSNVPSNLPSPFLTGTETYFRRIFVSIPSSSATVVVTMLSSLLAGMGTYISRISWKLPSMNRATVAASVPTSFLAGIGSHFSRIFCMWMMTSVPVSGTASDASSVEDQSSTYDVLKTYLLKTLECPVCYEVKSGPIFQCKNGHNVCSSCRPRINGDKCAVCNANLTSSRNWLAEELSTKLAGVPCKNALEGCEEIVLEGRMTQHLAECRFGYSCHVMTSVPADERYTDGDWLPCGWRGSYRDLLEHVEEEHPGHGYRSGDVTRMNISGVDLNCLSRVCDHVCLVAACGQLFWCRFALYHEANAFGFNSARPKLKVSAYARVVATAGSPVEDDYSCEFTLRTDACEALTLSVVCQTRQLGNNLEDETVEGQVLRLCPCILETFISSEKRLCCNVKFTNKN